MSFFINSFRQSYQKTGAYVKSVRNALDLSGKHARWIMQYDAKAGELKDWMSQMNEAFSDTNHGTIEHSL